MSSFQNGTYGFGTVLTADREKHDVEQPSKKARVLPPATSANEAVQFYFVDDWKQIPTKQQDLNRDMGRPPLFTNQIFEEEEIQGYEGLAIDIVLDMAQYIPRIFHKYTFKADKQLTEITSARFQHILMIATNKYFLATNYQERGPTLEEALKDCEVVHSFSHDLAETKGVDCRILHCIPATASAALRTLHARMHPLMLFYIDGCSGLQQDDPNMHLLLLVKYEADKPASVLGMLTFFELYAFPIKKRYRVAQVLIMPPVQKQGLGREILTAVNKMAEASKDAVSDIAYEDAAEPLQALRERMDAEAAAAIPEVWDCAQLCVRNACKLMASSNDGEKNGAATGVAGPSTSTALDQVDGDDDGLAPRQNDALDALEVGKETAALLRSKLKLVPQQVSLVWDVLLWAAAVRCKICSQDDITDLLQARVTHRELMDVAERLAKAPAEGDDVPPNKVVLDGDVLQAVEEQAAERDRLVWQEKDEGAGEAQDDVDVEAGEKEDGDKPAADISEAPTAASGEASSEEGDGDEAAPTISKLEYVMFRVDRRSKAVRTEKGLRSPVAGWSALNEEAKGSIVELVHDRREDVERIVHGMRWP